MSSKIHIAILDKQPLIRSALSYFLGRENDIAVVGTYSNRETLIADSNFLKVDTLIMDYSLGNIFDGIMLIKNLLFRHPELKIIIYSAQESIAIVQEAIAVGVKAYIGKSKGHEDLLAAIRKVSRHGDICLTPDLKLLLATFREPERSMHEFILSKDLEGIEKLKLQKLSTREIEVIRCMLEGSNITEISNKFARSRKTISGQKQSALRKLGLKSDMELFLYRDFILTHKGLNPSTNADKF